VPHPRENRHVKRRSRPCRHLKNITPVENCDGKNFELLALGRNLLGVRNALCIWLIFDRRNECARWAWRELAVPPLEVLRMHPQPHLLPNTLHAIGHRTACVVTSFEALLLGRHTCHRKDQHVAVAWQTETAHDLAAVEAQRVGVAVERPRIFGAVAD
jgi:hypothetical protein